jgi:hypothetical protein
VGGGGVLSQYRTSWCVGIKPGCTLVSEVITAVITVLVCDVVQFGRYNSCFVFRNSRYRSLALNPIIVNKIYAVLLEANVAVTY